MPKKRLTEVGVAKLKAPAQGSIDYYDTGMPGLVLRLNYGGAKTWRALYYVPTIAKSGKRQGQKISMPTTYELGRSPALSVKDAREKARAFINIAHDDPYKAKALAQGGADSFRDIADNFLKRHVEANKLRTQGEIERCFAKYVYPAWQHKRFRDIRRGDVAVLLDTIEDRHGKRMADIVLAYIRKLANWYAARNDDYSSPIVSGMGRNGGDHKRTRTLSDDEIRALWAACDGTYGAMVKVLLLTGQRRDKVATMQWDDVTDDGVWTIASAAREKANAGTLRLPPMVLDLIKAQPRIANNPHVFAGRGTVAINAFSDRKTELDAKLGTVPNWTLHDLRRTAKTLMARAGVRPDISERVLGHTIKGVEGVYDRHGYDVEKAEALVRLAALVETIINPPPANVVPLTKQTRKARP
jgi:integrase